MKKKDLTGQRFGKLVVLREDENIYRSPGGKRCRRWICQCDCGTVLSVLMSALTSKKDGTRSCGCTRKEKTRQNGHNLMGKRFGRLTVIGEVDLEHPEPNGNKRGWLCRCDCGNDIVATQKRLELLGLKSCGCLLSDTASEKINVANIVGHYKGTQISAIKPERGPNSNNKSGVKGVYWNKREGCWIASIGFQGKDIRLGRFKTIEDAEKARKKAEEELYAPIIEEFEKSK